MPAEVKEQKTKKHNCQLAEDYLNEYYQFRFNTVKGITEFKTRKTHTWQIINDYTENSLKREILAESGTYIRISDLRQILESSFSQPYDPFTEYFESLPPWDFLDYIRELSDSVTLKNEKLWYTYLKKWLIATVANSLNKQNCQNHTCLTLTGGQGKFKTTWLDHLIPAPLKDYQFTGKINPSTDNKDTQTLLAECLIINIDDQLTQLNKKDENDLKELITKPFVKYRKPYGRRIETHPRIASFCASVNGNDFLTDPTGSRRFLPFEVLAINIERALKVDMDKVFAQAYFLYKENERYWFNDEEILELARNNMEFQLQSVEEQLIMTYFELPESESQATHLLQPNEILSHLENFTKQRLSGKKLGEALNKLGFEKKRKTTNGWARNVYSVIQKEIHQIEAEQKINPTPF